MLPRSDYRLGALAFAELAPDPLVQFDRWFTEAAHAGLREPAAMALSTVSADGSADARIVLLRGTANGGFQFFTNYESKKARDLASTAQPHAALVFFWAELERQVRIRGPVTLVDGAASDAYFASRPRESQLGAWLSRQSSEAAPETDFAVELAVIEARFAGGPVPRPPHWGGYHVTPLEIEFWQGRPNRLHDRFLYWRPVDGAWTIHRLYP